MTNSPRNVASKAIRASAKVAMSVVLCAGMLWGTSAFAGNTTYQYDVLGRVIKVSYPDSKQICYTYDSAGNRTQVKRQAIGTCMVTGSTLSSSMTVETMLAAQQSSDLQTESVTTSTTDNQVTADSAATTTTSTADDSAITN